MKKIHELLILSALLLTIAEYTQAQNMAKNPFCEGITMQDCLAEHISEAEVIFEGTVLESTRYQDTDSIWQIKTVFEVEKVFKGDIKKGRVTQITEATHAIKYIKERHLKKYREHLNTGELQGPLEVGITSIIFGMYSSADRSVILSLFRFPDLTYQMGYAYYPFPIGKEHHILYHTDGVTEISFETTDELYKFILQQPNTGMKDYTHKQFIKPSFEEWKKIKKKSEKSGSVKQNGQNTSKEEPASRTIKQQPIIPILKRSPPCPFF